MIYLLHSNKPLGGTGQHSARHYLGYANEPTWRKRVKEHLTFKSNVAIVQAYGRIGATLVLTAVLPGGTRTDERKLKIMGRFARLCPLCNPKLQVGGTPEVVCLIPRKGASTLHSKKPATASGGGWHPLNSTLPTTPAGTALPVLSLVNGTSCGAVAADPETGG
jgi:hypothetical protein